MSTIIHKEQAIKGFIDKYSNELKKVNKIKLHCFKKTSCKKLFKEKIIIEREIVEKEYHFDEVNTVDNTIIAKGGIILFKIKKGYIADNLELFKQDDETGEDVAIHSKDVSEYFPNGGSLTYDGTLNFEVNFS